MLLTMASGGNSHDANPFGYTFHHPTDPYSSEQDISATAAQPVGPPLLDTSEANFLNHFLSNPDAAFDPSSAFLHPDLQPKNDPSQEYDWLYQEPPPTLHSVSAALATHSPVRQNRHHIPQPLPPPPQQQQQPSPLDRTHTIPDIHTRDEDVFGAASALFGTATQPSIHTHYLNESLYPGQGAVMSSLRVRDPVPSAISTTYFNPSLMASANAPQQRMGHNEGLSYGLSNVEVDENPYALFDSSSYGVTTDTGNPRLYRFDSDSHFASNGFLPSGPNDDAITSNLLFKMGAMLEPIVSAANSLPSSPVLARRNTINTSSSQSRPKSRETEGFSEGSDAERAEQGPKKRRKSKHIRDNLENLTPTARPQNSFATSERASVSGPTTNSSRPALSNVKSPTKRRKPSSPQDSQDNSTLRKNPRENLTEEQKRSNHIQSEQKRRNLIKQGFQDLEILVPELRSGGFSKSNMLVEAGKYLEQLLEGNETLRRMVGEQ